jgi:hypothetical protein
MLKPFAANKQFVDIYSFLEDLDNSSSYVNPLLFEWSYSSFAYKKRILHHALSMQTHL